MTSTSPLMENQYQRMNPVNENTIESFDHLPNTRVKHGEHGHLEKSNKKLWAVIALFIISLFSFVSQTELTSYLYNDLGFDQPYFLLMITHGSWILIWPIQVLCIALYKHVRRSHKHSYNIFEWSYFKRHMYESLRNQHRNIYKTSGIIIDEYYLHDHEYPHSLSEFIQSKSIMTLFKNIFGLTVILSVAGCTWYVAMAWAPASDITAIYNCSAFTALVFAIPILKEKFTYLKLCSVLLAVFGVVVVAYTGESSTTGTEYPKRLWGDLIIAVGAVMYGLYEVLYKKLCCPPINSVSSRRLVAFSNFSASLIGICSLVIVFCIVVLAHITGLNKVHFITSFKSWIIIILSVLSNLVFSLSFLALMSLTSPVLSSVSSLVTILFVGLAEFIFFGIKISFGQLVGDLFVVVGFVVLSISYWAEITEEDVDDDEDIDPTDTEN